MTMTALRYRGAPPPSVPPRHDGPDLPPGHTAAGSPDGPPEIGPARMTIAMVDEPETALGAAYVAARLAGLAASDELVVVYGSDGREPALSPPPMMMGLRRLLPRHTVIVLQTAPRDFVRTHEAMLLDELLDLGVLPIVVTPSVAGPWVAAELHRRLRADRVLTVAATPSASRGRSCTRAA
jgi:hypothetical protein